MPLYAPSPRGEVYLSAGAGTGSTNTAIMRFTNSDVSKAGTALTVTQSATNGDSITINEAGTYAIGLTMEGATGTACDAGISLNSAQLTTVISNITAANRITWAYAASATADTSISCSSRTLSLAAGDVLRGHTKIAPTNTSVRSYFYVCKVSN
jgi:hypothetical protein